MGSSSVPPTLTFAFELRAALQTPVDLGETPRGRQRMVPITSGSFEGPALRGRVLPGGADWQTIYPDGASLLDARYALETDGGALVAVHSRGIRHAAPEVMARLHAGEIVDPSLVYFKTTPMFETAAADLQWLTRSVFVGSGERRPLEVIIRFWRVE